MGSLSCVSQEPTSLSRLTPTQPYIMANKNEPRNKEVVTGSATYEGETKDGMKHGMGTLTWDDGDQYVGEFRFDEKTTGTFRWKGGDTYTGEWKDSLMHGKGTYTYKNNRRYEGQWFAGYKQGFGVFSWPNKDIYVGQFLKDMCNGVGIQSYADGRIYKGHWSNNRKHGYGTLRLANNEKIEGEWLSNSLTAKAIHTEANGQRFEEHYRDGIAEGSRKPLKRTGAEMEKALAATTPPAWMPDDKASACFSCDVQFSLFNRKHHYRHCGHIFCNDCTTHRIVIERFNMPTEQRVCGECYLAIKTDIKVDIPDFLVTAAGSLADY